MTIEFLTQRLSRFVDLTSHEREAVAEWGERPLSVCAKQDVTRAGEPSNEICVILQGWACQSVDNQAGERQIVRILLPGDIANMRAVLLDASDNNVMTFTDASVALISKGRFLTTLDRFPRIREALWYSALVDEGIAKQWIVSLGRRDARKKIAVFFCEQWVRGDMVGLVHNERLELPLTQKDIGDIVGLTSVHVNRSLKALREADMLRTPRVLTRLQVARMAQMADFDLTYLQLARRR